MIGLLDDRNRLAAHMSHELPSYSAPPAIRTTTHPACARSEQEAQQGARSRPGKCPLPSEVTPTRAAHTTLAAHTLGSPPYGQQIESAPRRLDAPAGAEGAAPFLPGSANFPQHPGKRRHPCTVRGSLRGSSTCGVAGENPQNLPLFWVEREHRARAKVALRRHQTGIATRGGALARARMMAHLVMGKPSPNQTGTRRDGRQDSPLSGGSTVVLGHSNPGSTRGVSSSGRPAAMGDPTSLATPGGILPLLIRFPAERSPPGRLLIGAG